MMVRKWKLGSPDWECSLCRLHEIGNGKVSPVPTSIKFVDDKSADNCADIDGNSPRRKQLHCSFCGHPGSKIDHMKFSCKYCISDDDEGCIKKPEGFICGCLSCDVVCPVNDWSV